MRGTRPLDNNEIRKVAESFDGTFTISELLSLTIGDVYQNRAAVTDLLFDRSIVKGGEVSRAVPINRDGRLAIDDLIAWHREQYGNTEANRPLFPSRHKSGTVPLHRQTAHQMLRETRKPISRLIE